MKKSLEKIFMLNEIVWPQLLPVVVVILSIILCSKWVFFIGAIISILFYGCFAFEIHNIDTKKDNPRSRKKSWATLEENKFFIYNQYWLNGLGAFVGWIALYILLFYVIKISHYPLSIAIWIWVKNLGIKDLILVILSFLGLTGYIPYYVLLGRGSSQV